MAKDYYQILGVDRTATEDDIKKAFRKKAHEHHPDKDGGDETKFKEINEAYQTLGNKQKRGQYDQFGSAFDRNGGPQGFAW
ncbi:MAG: DnaJ domain-containing protein, partial [Patescibacteria group bacterium]